MPITITMPALSPTMTEGTLARWLKKEGEKVEPGEVLAEIETDKATMEMEAADEGILGKILVPEGTEGVKVNEPIAVLLEEGEDPEVLEHWRPEGGAPAAPEAAAVASPEPAPTPAAAPEPPSASSPAAPPTPSPAPAAPAPAPHRERIFASPLARRMAERAGLDLSRIRGTGPHGRIVKADVERALAAREAAPAAAAEAAAVSGAYEEVPLSTMRKVIARRLVEAKQTIPHFYLTIDCIIDALLDLRRQLNARPGADYKLSVNDFIIKAVALAMRQVPDVNASWGGDRILRYRDVDIAVAVAVPGGLVTPVIRHADEKGLVAISKEMKELAARAREGKLAPEEYQGGGFSISNLGMYGVREFAAIINPPQACILAVGAAERRPIVRDEEIGIATVMTCTLSVDHRVVDGALGAEFLKVFRTAIEDPLGLLL